ncbi:MAG: response regulator transcription factor [Bacteroidetes bacterium]|nr:response regulator transcription factor [Bacteroidota bacterium]MBK8144836.1 response regulator transcription factor [Bacteroidota bacterium]MBP6314268.1 response regulator transcription factor [Chitinophagaceae bacterium]
MNVIIIEDEKLSAEHLATMIHRVDASIEVVHYFDSVKSAVKGLANGVSADLLFVDIHLADGLSFEIFSKVEVETPIIFTTAYDQYAIKAFKWNSIDYLLKPIGIEELRTAIEKYHRYSGRPQTTVLDNLSLAYQQLSKSYKSRFLVKSGQTIDSIKVEDILHFQTQDSVTFLVIANGKRYPIDYTLEQLEALVSPADFFRINRKILVRISSIEKVSTHFNNRLHITAKYVEGEMAIVSRERVQGFKLWLDH